MKVRCSVPEKTVLSVDVLTVESANRALMPSFVAVRVGTWLEAAHRTQVGMVVMLNLGLIHRLQ